MLAQSPKPVRPWFNPQAGARQRVRRNEHVQAADVRLCVYLVRRALCMYVYVRVCTPTSERCACAVWLHSSLGAEPDMAGRDR